MEKRVVIVCCVVGFLGLLSAAAGFAAEAKKLKDDEVRSGSECIYMRTPAAVLALTAAVALIFAQIIINIAIGCRCCTRSAARWISWVTFVVSSFLLVSGAFFNCFYVHTGVFAGGAAASLATVALGIFALISGKDGNETQGQGGVAMVRFEEGPAFVHEDTYARRQLAGGGF